MKIVYDHDRCTLLHGDSAALGEVLAENSVDALVCDPPSGIGFMGNAWDKDKGGRDAWIEWLAKVLAPSVRALKPGGHGLIWALPRTTHWTAFALENSGLEIRDRVSHIFGSGFPKSLTHNSADIPPECGTALKPAIEDWWLVRKPLDGSVAATFAKWGTGVIWIDACRVGDEDTRAPTGNRPDNGWGMGQGVIAGSAHGRWPAHLVLDDEAAEMLDEQAGTQTGAHGRVGGQPRKLGYKQDADGITTDLKRSIGGPSRFFYVAKPSKKEKDRGLGHLPVLSGGEATHRKDNSAGLTNPRAGAGRGGGGRNPHETVKSIALMRWLCRLVTPPNGVVLDPFAGSGSTGVAALEEGFNFIGCELTEKYIPALTGRITNALSGTAPAADA